MMLEHIVCPIITMCWFLGFDAAIMWYGCFEFVLKLLIERHSRYFTKAIKIVVYNVYVVVDSRVYIGVCDTHQ